ncbi:IS66 Orf2 like protein (plasmid) [Sodalis glossinidius str. 'morsitans']|uniref:IS66 Orf2 like protein n=1 Tax=Sodalis glossinidius (strain morsitans) TaxID=343509 RepID=A0A193QNY1_SODGM|nr:IS66 family insertion sequence element accessory protein TnpB [Sodalis glossinidius]CAI59303.1 Tpn3 protein [Sodalis glossinidius]CAI59476.1 Tpn3 protein [Sodalis glossinidius]CRL46857.1 IS66 Orf2 like protein [Sodalis glossinidius str. 'morsitans']
MKMFVDVPAIYLYPGHVDFRKSINGLVLIIEQNMAHSPFDEALFVFCNRPARAVSVKVVVASVNSCSGSFPLRI